MRESSYRETEVVREPSMTGGAGRSDNLRGKLLTAFDRRIPFDPQGRLAPVLKRRKAMAQWATREQGFHGPIYALFDGASFIAPDAYWTELVTNETCNAGTCSGRGGKLLVDFGSGDSLVLTLQHGTYTPGYNTAAFGVWRGTMSVVEGHRLFRDATGLLTFDGTWTIWVDEAGFHGVFNGSSPGMSAPGRSSVRRELDERGEAPGDRRLFFSACATRS